MKRHITRGIAITATAAFATLLVSVAPAQATESTTDSSAPATTSATRYYGPYADEGTCNYWKHAVAAATGLRVHGCFFDIGWYFYTY
jgi:exo-beta-1,3-glucanase (GH17 family)